MLLFSKCSEKVDFAFARRFPRVIAFEGAFEMCFDVDVEGLGFELGVGRVVHARNCLRRSEMMQVAGEFSELSTRALLLTFLVLLHFLLLVVV